ncbi:Regulator of sigma-E protease RseP [Candidatus Erwinia haradaeae]|uniref:Zinc metalloprotease n=1 Tax=Candidatus Erwinia haradaeae TaxID=1922217 RepID=A0A451DCF5_9GAMM|nr:sigma E protease regulator RseP [Candidatus Erwinia haradaeae]VFP84101.1 Regulator of sigma-E protease RseP [Candidatus Erwinia haradaeae]
MLSFFWSLLFFILALVVLISVHEFGHFLVARWCGVQVERFSIGFGKVLWRRIDKKGTEYVLALIPIGGYVKMLDNRVETVSSMRSHQTFNNKSIWQRAAIVIAGPLANFIFALFAYWVVFVIGVPGVRPVIASIIEGSPVAEAGVSPGMELRSINGIETPDWDAVYAVLSETTCDQVIDIKVAPLHSTEISHKIIHMHENNCNIIDERDPVLSLGIQPTLPSSSLVLAAVQKYSAGSRAGLQVGDIIITASGRLQKDWYSFNAIVRQNPGIPIPLEVEREGRKITCILIPEMDPYHNTQGFAGIAPRVISLPNEYRILRQYGIFDAFGKASMQTWKIINLTTSMLKTMMTGGVTLHNISGPISIAKGAGKSAEYGLIYYMMFLALISINLGIMNLLPLPVLDGGHLLFLFIEKIIGRPVSEVIYQLSYSVSLIILMLLTGLAFFNDLSHF